MNEIVGNYLENCAAYGEDVDQAFIANEEVVIEPIQGKLQHEYTYLMEVFESSTYSL
jgi:hypothetical protein